MLAIMSSSALNVLKYPLWSTNALLAVVFVLLDWKNVEISIPKEPVET